MTMRLTPDLQNKSYHWHALLQQFKLDAVMSAMQLEGIWQKMLCVAEPVIWYQLNGFQTEAETAELKRMQSGGSQDICSQSIDSQDICSQSIDSQDRSGWQGQIIVAVTLGEGIDRLEDQWTQDKRLLDVYAVDCLSMIALQTLYDDLAEILKKERQLYIVSYDFKEKDYAVILQQLAADIAVSEGGMMRPMKSVVYTGNLTGDQTRRCTSVCSTCKHPCSQRQEMPDITAYKADHQTKIKEMAHKGKGVAAYTYGYQRIFGEQ